MKEFLKKDENRNNLYFYKEYALIELEMGRFSNCMNILETAIQSQGTCPSAICVKEQRFLMYIGHSLRPCLILERITNRTDTKSLWSNDT